MTTKQTSAGLEPEQPLTCVDCHSEVRTEWHDYTFNYGVGDAATQLTTHIPVEVCVSCGAGSYGYKAERLKHETVCAHHGVLTPREIRAIRDDHNLTQAEFGELTGIGEATLHRWENGLLIQNRSSDRYLRLIKAGRNLQFLRRMVRSLEDERAPASRAGPQLATEAAAS